MECPGWRQRLASLLEYSSDRALAEHVHTRRIVAEPARSLMHCGERGGADRARRKRPTPAGQWHIASAFGARNSGLGVWKSRFGLFVHMTPRCKLGARCVTRNAVL